MITKIFQNLIKFISRNVITPKQKKKKKKIKPRQIVIKLYPPPKKSDTVSKQPEGKKPHYEQKNKGNMHQKTCSPEDNEIASLQL